MLSSVSSGIAGDNNISFLVMLLSSVPVIMTCSVCVFAGASLMRFLSLCVERKTQMSGCEAECQHTKTAQSIQLES